ncbi:MAG: aldehyde dehydrogenase family protein [Desulfobacteraceae bacterium]|nr:aldehyde dehydrogenase family protein [Desulfobacteraceae bacterium]
MSDVLQKLGIDTVNPGATSGGGNGWLNTGGGELTSVSPIDGKPIAAITQATADDYAMVMKKAQHAFEKWRMVPAPQRGRIVREIGEALRRYKEPLGKLVTLEMGKTIQEGYGEVQEMIDIADFAVGLSRQLHGLTMHSERPRHRMYEQWHPLGIVGVVTAFNFPVAVWSWNALIAAVCGDVVVWKPSSKTPLTAIAVQNIISPIVDEYDIDGVFNLVVGKGSDVGETMITDRRIPLISATGSTGMGRHIGETVAGRLGRTLLELGGNNAIIITKNADIPMALNATLFGAIGTTGQRCTSTRRIIIDKSIKDQFVSALIEAYKQIRIGDPQDENTIMGPVVDTGAIDAMQSAIKSAVSEGGKLLCGGERTAPDGLEGGFYVKPAIMEVANHYRTVQEETFAPLLYIIPYEDLDDAIAIHNDVPQGLSSAIFTDSITESETFLSHAGSDCGIANVNIGTSGAEIGGAFGGEKDTGGGRESGSDAWKVYMRRQTNTINWGRGLPLAQGIEFKV